MFQIISKHIMFQKVFGGRSPDPPPPEVYSSGTYIFRNRALGLILLYQSQHETHGQGLPGGLVARVKRNGLLSTCELAWQEV